MSINLSLIDAIAGRPVNRANAEAVLGSLNKYGSLAGLDLPHRQVPFLAQVMHESAGFHYDKEVWGPTSAQVRYEGRKDLGNVYPGDGKRFAGRTAIQITGRANYAAFRDWCRENVNSPIAPDFTEDPDAVCSDPWEGLCPIWYWSTRDLNRYADEGNNEMITRRINGGLNGYDDRLRLYTATGLAMLGYNPTAIRVFQMENGLKVDGIAGPATRAAIHEKLKALPVAAAPLTIEERMAAMEAKLAEILSLLEGRNDE